MLLPRTFKQLLFYICLLLCWLTKISPATNIHVQRLQKIENDRICLIVSIFWSSLFDSCQANFFFSWNSSSSSWSCLPIFCTSCPALCHLYVRARKGIKYFLIWRQNYKTNFYLTMIISGFICGFSFCCS